MKVECSKSRHEDEISLARLRVSHKLGCAMARK